MYADVDKHCHLEGVGDGHHQHLVYLFGLFQENEGDVVV
jgi:hypothetical protein